MRLLSVFVWVAGLVVVAGPTLAANQRDLDDCNQTNDWDRRISGCTLFLQARDETTKNRVIAYSNRGDAYHVKGDSDRAIADYNEAIRLDPKYVQAYHDRASAYLAKGLADRAIADYNEAIRLDPTRANTYFWRGIAYSGGREYNRAIADYNATIRLVPNFRDIYRYLGRAYLAKGEYARAIAYFDEAISRNSQSPQFTYFGRGQAHLYEGSLAKALADFQQANKLAPKNARMALWLYIAERRNNLPSRLAQSKSQLDMKSWPAPLVSLFLGEFTLSQAFSAADDADPKKKQLQVCEANFYSGALALLRGAKEEALGLFQLVDRDCSKGSIIPLDTTNLELRALGVKP